MGAPRRPRAIYIRRRYHAGVHVTGWRSRSSAGCRSSSWVSSACCCWTPARLAWSAEVSALPALNAALNATCAALLVGRLAGQSPSPHRRAPRVHAGGVCRLRAVPRLLTSSITRSPARALRRAGLDPLRVLPALVSHVVLAAVMVPFVLTTVYRGALRDSLTVTYRSRGGRCRSGSKLSRDGRARVPAALSPRLRHPGRASECVALSRSLAVRRLLRAHRALRPRTLAPLARRGRGRDARSTSAAAPAATFRSTAATTGSRVSIPHATRCSPRGAARPGVPLVQATPRRLPFRDGAFDTVVSGLSLQRAGAARGLAESGACESAGTLRMLEHVRASGGLKARVQDRWQPLWTRLTGGCTGTADRAQRAGGGLSHRRGPRAGRRATCGGSSRGEAEGAGFDRPVQSRRGHAVPPAAPAGRRGFGRDAGGAALGLARARAGRVVVARDRPRQGGCGLSRRPRVPSVEVATSRSRRLQERRRLPGGLSIPNARRDSSRFGACALTRDHDAAALGRGPGREARQHRGRSRGALQEPPAGQRVHVSIVPGRSNPAPSASPRDEPRMSPFARRVAASMRKPAACTLRSVSRFQWQPPVRRVRAAAQRSCTRALRPPLARTCSSIRSVPAGSARA